MQEITETSYYRMGLDYGLSEVVRLEPIQQTVILREKIKTLPDYKAQTEFLLGARDAGIDYYIGNFKKVLLAWSAGKTNGELAFFLKELNQWLYTQGVIK